MDLLSTTVLEDIFDNHRHFVGTRPSRAEIVTNLSRPILIDGLDREETILMLSFLPKHSDSLLVSPLDKGLSGSKVYAARFSLPGGRRSLAYVFKIGGVEKIQREYDVMEDLVVPHVSGLTPVGFRRSVNKALLFQSLAGLGEESPPTSLRLYARETDNTKDLISRLFRVRLAGWYSGDSPATRRDVGLGEVFARNLRKGGDVSHYPEDWRELNDWVAAVCGFKWEDAAETLRILPTKSINSPISIVHGDLHSQNVLVDDRGECWPIDFAWSRSDSSPIVDLVMLEASLKFLAFPMRSDLRTLLKIELELSQEPAPRVNVGMVPYREELIRVSNYIIEIRKVATEFFHFDFADYLRAMTLMTFGMSNHPQLNRPYVLGSLQLLAGRVGGSL